MRKETRALGEQRGSECNLSWGIMEGFLESVIINVLPIPCPCFQEGSTRAPSESSCRTLPAGGAGLGMKKAACESTLGAGETCRFLIARMSTQLCEIKGAENP